MEKKNLDWANLGFGYVKTDKRFVANYKDGAWDDGVITEDDKVVISECAGVLQYAQTCFEGLKAYTTEDAKTNIQNVKSNKEQKKALPLHSSASKSDHVISRDWNNNFERKHPIF